MYWLSLASTPREGRYPEQRVPAIYPPCTSDFQLKSTSHGALNLLQGSYSWSSRQLLVYLPSAGITGIQHT